MNNQFLLIIFCALLSSLMACQLEEAEKNDEVKQVLDPTIDYASYGIDTMRLVPTGLKVGEQAPDFKGIDQDGNAIKLSEQLKNAPVVLIFYRGAWCGYCNQHLNSLEDAMAMIADANVIAITPEGSEGVNSIVDKIRPSMAILSDSDGSIMENYKVNFKVTKAYEEKILTKLKIDLKENNSQSESELPIPATYVIDQKGIVQYAFFDLDYRNRAPVKEIAKALKGLK